MGTSSREKTLKPQSSRVPPRGLLWVCAILMLIPFVLRRTDLVGDNALVNILTLVCTFLTLMTLAVWFVFKSGFRRSTRWVTAGTVLLSLALLAVLFEIRNVSGEMVPELAWRFAPEPDRELDSPVVDTVSTQVDLTSSSELDFPQFLGPNRDARFDAVRLVSDWEENQPELLWKQPIGAGWSAFSAVNGFAVTQEQRGDRELVTCYQVETGQLAWSFSVEGRHSTVLGGVGPRSTPTIHRENVFALTATGKLVCLSGSTGQELWSDDLLRRYGVTPQEDLLAVAWGRAGSPLVVDDLVVVPAGGPRDGKKHSLIAFRMDTGEVEWESGTRQVSYSSPVVATVAGTRQILSVNENTLSGHDPRSGSLLWEHDWPGSSVAQANNSQPVVLSGDRIFVSRGYHAGGMMLRLAASTGEKPFQVEELWRNRRVLKTKFTNVAEHEDYLYGLSDGILECVSAADGRRQWKRGRYYHGQILAVNDHLLVLTEGGDVVLGQMTPERWTELSRFDALSGKTWNNICLYGEHLLVRNAEEAACYRLPLVSSAL